jgi:hypothetical protein
MLKYLSILAALVGLGTSPVYAQKQEAVLQHVQVPGSGFDLVLATPRAGAPALPDLGNIPEAFVVHLHGGRLVAIFEDAEAMLRAADSLQSPVFASDEGTSQQPIAIYAVPTGRRVALAKGF